MVYKFGQRFSTVYNGFGIQRTAIIPPFKFLKWKVHLMAMPLFMTAIDRGLTIVLKIALFVNDWSLNAKSTVSRIVSPEIGRL